MLVTVEIDVAYDEPALKRWFREPPCCDLHPKVISWNGPGGGWPVVRLTICCEKRAIEVLKSWGYTDPLETYTVKE